MTKRFGFTLAEGATHVGICDNARREAFTLAEVLITLGIIGVVAAMTIPTLISNTNGAQFKTAYKKALSTLNQAVLMNVAMDDTDFSGMVKDGGDGTTVEAFLGARLSTATDITDRYGDAIPALGNFYANDGDDTAVTVTNAPDVVFAFADGTAFAYNKTTDAACTKEAPCYGYIDVNSESGPNQVVACDSETGTDEKACEVSGDNIKDIFPVKYYGQTIEPASNAARAVLFGK
ncbi:MAG: prepilin-type N-terminal cleavage/methylation domain-containing protein [Cyanobacteria bacterium SIG32]|nr:prepilin-type N-terminal cleavage/methylation domain-containing protein [Cyanobacteria bacterium SIG32]